MTISKELDKLENSEETLVAEWQADPAKFELDYDDIVLRAKNSLLLSTTLVTVAEECIQEAESMFPEDQPIIDKAYEVLTRANNCVDRDMRMLTLLRNINPSVVGVQTNDE